MIARLVLVGLAVCFVAEAAFIDVDEMSAARERRDLGLRLQQSMNHTSKRLQGVFNKGQKEIEKTLENSLDVVDEAVDSAADITETGMEAASNLTGAGLKVVKGGVRAVGVFGKTTLQGGSEIATNVVEFGEQVVVSGTDVGAEVEKQVLRGGADLVKLGTKGIENGGKAIKKGISAVGEVGHSGARVAGVAMDSAENIFERITDKGVDISKELAMNIEMMGGLIKKDKENTSVPDANTKPVPDATAKPVADATAKPVPDATVKPVPDGITKPGPNGNADTNSAGTGGDKPPIDNNINLTDNGK